MLNIYALDIIYIKNPKEGYINDYYDTYVQTLSVPVDFYNISAVLPSTHYATEFNDRFFIDTLNKNKIITSLGYDKSPDLKDIKMISSILTRANNYLVDILNKEVPLDEKFLFSNIYSEKILAKKIVDNEVFLIKSKHIIYRETKMYGIALSITTLHSLVDKVVKLIDFELYGFIFEDKVNTFEPSNLIDNDYQDYRKDKIQMRDPKYENQFLCQYFDDLYKFRGITADVSTLNCTPKSDFDDGTSLDQ